MDKYKKHVRIIGISLLFLTGINAIIAGTLFIIEPSGKGMGMSTTYLSHSPFSTFLLPGITLLVVNGIMNMVTAILSIKKHTWYPLLLIVQGLLLSGWIILQIIWVNDFNWLHVTMLSIGAILVACGRLLKSDFSWS